MGKKVTEFFNLLLVKVFRTRSPSQDEYVPDVFTRLGRHEDRHAGKPQGKQRNDNGKEREVSHQQLGFPRI